MRHFVVPKKFYLDFVQLNSIHSLIHFGIFCRCQNLSASPTPLWEGRFGKGTRCELEVYWEEIQSMESVMSCWLETGGDLFHQPVMPMLPEFVPLLWQLL